MTEDRQLTSYYNQVFEKIKHSGEIDLASTEESQDSSIIIKEAIRSITSISMSSQKRIESEFLGLGPLENLLNDPDITEIMINGPQQIWYEKAGYIEKHKQKFLSPLSYNNFIHKICLEAGVEVNLDRPFTNGLWSSFRLHMINPPLTPEHTHISLRKQPENPWTLSNLEKTQWANYNDIGVLKKIIQEKKSFIIVGPTGSGKTSVLNACLQELPKNERVISIEDTDEIKLPNSLSVKLLTRIDPHQILKSFTQTDLLIQSLRMRPQRLIVGEVRGAEAKDMLMAFATGHQGGICTLHAENARQALLRLEMLTQLGAPQWNLQAIRHLIFLSLQYVVVLDQKDGDRHLEGIYKIASLEDFGFLLEKVSSDYAITSM